MQKVEGSSPFIRLPAFTPDAPRTTGAAVVEVTPSALAPHTFSSA
jgi:hypothetical protein